MPTEKKCKRCSITKPISEFQRVPGKYAYYRGICRQCRSTDEIARTADRPRECRGCRQVLPTDRFPVGRLRAERPLCLACKPMDIKYPERVVAPGKLHECLVCHQWKTSDEYIITKVSADLSYVRKDCRTCHNEDCKRRHIARQAKKGHTPRKAADPELVAEEYWHARNALGMTHGAAVRWLAKGGYCKTEEGVELCLKKVGVT